MERLTALEELWGNGPGNCLVVPNFSIGAVLMMKMSELAAPHFPVAEVIEMHHDHKADAPIGNGHRHGLENRRRKSAAEASGGVRRELTWRTRVPTSTASTSTRCVCRACWLTRQSCSVRAARPYRSNTTRRTDRPSCPVCSSPCGRCRLSANRFAVGLETLLGIT